MVIEQIEAHEQITIVPKAIEAYTAQVANAAKILAPQWKWYAIRHLYEAKRKKDNTTK